MKKILIPTLIVFLMCNLTSSWAQEVCKISMLPRYAPEEIYSRLAPLADFLSKTLGAPVEPVIKRNYSEYEKQVKSGHITIGYQNPSVYVRVSDVHEALAMVLKGKGGDKFRGVIIVRDDSSIRSIEDLRHKRICIVSYASTGGYLSPKLTLMRAGIDVEKECELAEAVDSKQENVILSVFAGEYDAGFIRESALHMADAYFPSSRIRILAHSAWMPNYCLSVKRDLPEKNKQAIRNALAGLKKDDPVLKALKIDGFRMVTDAAYDAVREAVGINVPVRD